MELCNGGSSTHSHRSLNTGSPTVALLSLFPLLLVQFHTRLSHPPILWGMNVLRIITHLSCGECICDVSSHPLAAASRHELPWKHLATQASDSLSWLGVVKLVKWNRWDSVALPWSFCTCYLRHQDFIISYEIFIFSNGLLMYFLIIGVSLWVCFCHPKAATINIFLH